MPTGFDKFSKKALAEEGISIMPKGAPKEETKETPEKKEVEKLSAAAKVGERKPAKAPKAEKTEKDETFQMTIVIRMDTKRKLDEMKFFQRRSYKELAEEAFEDLYKKYGK